jgi:uncharacterized protein YndB with AHSA1/START domain
MSQDVRHVPTQAASFTLLGGYRVSGTFLLSEASPMSTQRITVDTTIAAPLSEVWSAYTNPDDVTHWNFASEDWHCPSASADLRVGGTFRSRMEAKDGSFGFEFEGVYTRIEPQSLLEYSFGDRTAQVQFTDGPLGVRLQVSFDAESSHSLEQQRDGWQAILNNFKRYVEKKVCGTSPAP